MVRIAFQGIVLALLFLLPHNALAQQAALDLNRLRPALGSEKIVTTDLATVGPNWQLVPQLFLHYADLPMVLTMGGEREANVVENRVTGDFSVSLALKERFQLGLSFPVTLTQGGEPIDLMPLESGGEPVNPPSEISSTGAEDLRVSLKGLLWRDELFGVGAVGHISLPTGNGNSYLGSGSPTLDVRLVGHMRRDRFSAAAQLGWLFASTQQVLLTRTGMALTFGVGAQYEVIQRENLSVAVAAELFGLAHSRFETTREAPIEALFAGKARRDDWTFFVGLGPGLTPGYGEPRIRILAGVSYAWKPSPKPELPLVEVQPLPPPPTPLPPPPPPERERPVWIDSTMTLRSELFFLYDKCAINPISYEELRDIARRMAEHPEWGNIRIEGHASQEGDGKAGYNLRLSRCRAQRIAEFFEYYGVEGSRLSYFGFGYSCPREDNASEEGRGKNRRVEFVRNPEKNQPTCPIPEQLDPLEKHANEPRLYREGGAPAQPGTGTTPAPGTAPTGTQPGPGQPGAKPAPVPPTATQPAPGAAPTASPPKVVPTPSSQATPVQPKS